MRRKLIKHGMSSLLVSLPSRWVKENNLQKGEEIEVEEGQGRVVISAEKHYKVAFKETDVSGAGLMIKKMVGACYKAGYDEVLIRFSNFSELSAIQTVVREQFNGFELISQSKDSVRIKNLSQIRFEEFDNGLRRFFLIMLQIQEDSAKAIKAGDYEWLRQTCLLKKDADKFADYCRRAINMGYNTRYSRNAPLYTIIEQLEKVVDRYKEMGYLVFERKMKLSDELCGFYFALCDFAREFYEMFYNFHSREIVEFGKRKENLQNRIEGILKMCKKDEIIVAVKLERVLNIIFDLNGPLMAVYF